MNGVRFALDSTTAVYCLNNIPGVLERYHAEIIVALPAATVGELLFGAMKSKLRTDNLERYERFIENAIVLPIDMETCRHYAEIKLNLERAGTPIPVNDMWIAASCLRHGLTLAADDGHYDNVAGLPVENWYPRKPPKSR